MSSAFYQHDGDMRGPSLRRRGAAFGLALAIHALLLVMLLTLAPQFVPFMERRSAPITVDLLPEARVTTTRAGKVEKAKENSGGAAAKPVAPVARVVVPVVEKPPPLPLPPVPPLDFVRITKQDLASLDRTLATRSTGHGAGKAGDREGEESGAGEGAGEGPGGERLYSAQWYRRPTNAELSPYLPASARGAGWGMIACQMVEDYRVENCREIGQAPLGSGLARAVRQAAWQFRVLPPRIGGRVIKGAWVRIRIEYTQGGELRTGG